MRSSGDFFRFITLLIFTSVLSLQAQKLAIRNFNVQNGLAQSQVKTIIQDSLGYLWLGTADGLSRFDGQHFRNFTRWDGLAGNDVTCSFMENDSVIWFGHGQEGISKYYVYKEKFISIAIDSLLRGKRIRQIYKDKQGNIWISATRLGLLKLKDNDYTLFTKKDGLPGSQVRGVVQDEKGYLWVATENGLAKFKNKAQAHKATFRVLRAENGLPENDITAIIKDKHGYLWLGTRNSGLVRFDPRKRALTKKDFQRYTVTDGLADNWVWTLYENRKGNILAGTFAGVSIYRKPVNDEKGRFSSITVKNGLSQNLVLSIYQDREFNLWFGTWGGGVCQYIGSTFTTYTVDDGLPSNSVWAFLEDSRKNFWIATEKGVLRSAPGGPGKKGGRIERFTGAKGLPVNYVSSLLEDDQGQIWFGTYGGGIYLYNPATGGYRVFSLRQGLKSKYITAMAKDKDGRVWVTTLDKGIFLFDKRSGRFKNIFTDTASSSFYAVFRDRESRLWFATHGSGILMYNGEKITRFGKGQGFDFCSFTSIAQDKNGAMWFGSSGGGLYRLKDGRCRVFTTKNGLSGDNIFSLLCDKRNDLWIGTKSGLDRFNLQDSTIRHFGLEQGFLGMEANQNAVYEDSRGMLWFGAIGGAGRFNPLRYAPNLVPPKIDLCNVLLFFKEDSLVKKKVFPYDKNHLTFNYTALSFTNPGQIRYRFKLEGFDKDWQAETKKNSVTYSNLPAGDYQFRVRVKNEQGLWSREDAVYTFTIRGPFWQAWWFYVLLVLFVVSFIAYFHLRSVRRVEQQRDVLEKEVNERTKELKRQKDVLTEAYRALRESETNFRTLTETAASAIFIFQGDKFVYVNPETERLTGYSKNELLNMGFWEVVHPEFQELIRKRGKARQQGEKVPNRYEFKLLTKGGQERWIDFTAGKIEYRGKPAGLGTVFDITDRKKMEEAIKDNEARLRALINAMPDIVRFKDGQGRWLTSNAFDLSFLGIENINYVGKSNKEIAASAPFFKESLENCAVSDEAAWEKGMVMRSEEIIPRPEGGENIFDVIKVPLFNEDGSRKGLVIIGRDITERKIAEQELRMEKERLSVTLQNLGEAVISTDVSGKIILLNESAQMLLGFREQELLGRRLSSVWSLYSLKNKKLDVDPVEYVLKEVKAYQPSTAIQLRTTNRAGITIEFNCSPLFVARGRLIGTVVVFRDITDKKKLEEELLKTRKLESLGILAGGLAHDFNNILTAIIGNISLASFLLEGKQEKKVSDLLIKAEKSSMRAQGLTQQLLTFSRGGAPVKKTASLRELVESSVEFALHGSQTVYSMEFAEDLWAVEIDEGQINQALNNLTINAMQAMPAGGRIKILAENILSAENASMPLPAGKYVKLVVEDNGIGIKQEHLERIFDPYFSTKQKGSGLGLATTFSIIHKHGGLITVDSRLGEGTRFTIYLPATDKKISEAPEKKEENLRGAGRILIMDDEKDVRELVKSILENSGYEVETCADGKELLDKYKKLKSKNESYDLSIMDLTVPGGMGGKETIKRLQKLQPEALAIVSSGYSNDPIMANYKDYGFAGVIAKPYSAAKLLGMVKALLA